MTETQDVLEPSRRRRRRAPAILLGGLTVAVASTAVAGAYAFAPTVPPRASSPAESALAAPHVSATITAADTAEPGSTLHTVAVRTPEPEPEPVPPSAVAEGAPEGTAPSASSDGSTTTSAPATRSVDFTAYCANPQAPAGASSVGGLLAAVNAERAKAGIAPLSWSGDLAATAAAWSATMAAQDSSTDAPADALSHNPSPPGAENVGVTYRSTGLSESSAMNTLHVNWVYSSGHCTNLMNPAYSQMGAGAAATEDGTTWYATENFR